MCGQLRPGTESWRIGNSEHALNLLQCVQVLGASPLNTEGGTNVATVTPKEERNRTAAYVSIAVACVLAVVLAAAAFQVYRCSPPPSLSPFKGYCSQHVAEMVAALGAECRVGVCVHIV